MRRAVLLLAAVLAVAACASRGSTPPQPAATFSPTASTPALASPAASAPAPQTGPDVPEVTGTIPAHCGFRGTAPDQLPDPACTPGAYDPALTAKVLCARGYDSEANRPPEADTDRFKYGVAYPAYGVPRSTPTELDHLIPRELGGINTAANLWPEVPPSPNPKDKVEDALKQWVCAAEYAGNDAQAEGRLAGARQAIAADWLTAEAVLGVDSSQASP